MRSCIAVNSFASVVTIEKVSGGTGGLGGLRLLAFFFGGQRELGVGANTLPHSGGSL